MPEGCAWVNYVRCHDDIGWSFANEDAAEIGINGDDHRRFLNAFFTGRFEGSFASGLPFNYSMQIDVGRFVTKSLVVRGGMRGSGSIGGDDAEDLATGQGAPALHAFAGLLHYFTPQSMASFYAGADYVAQLTQRDGPDAGTIIGVAGVQGALSSRVSLFLESGYGAALQKNDDDVRVTRIVGQVGVRLKF